MKENKNAVTAYIAARPESHQQQLESLRNLIVSQLPDSVIEGMAWSMPSYWEKTYLIHFQDYSNHMNLYIGPKAVDHFSTIYANLRFSKRGIKLTYEESLPQEEIKAMLKWLYDTYAQ